MTVELYYSGKQIPIDIPDGVEVDEFAPVQIDKPLTFEQFKAEFQDSEGTEFVGEKLPLVVVNDASVTAGNDGRLPQNAYGHGSEMAGAHRPPTS